MSKVLITGVAGFIGSHLAEALLKEGKTVIGIDNFDAFYAREIKENNLSHFKNHPQFSFYEVDIRDQKDFNKIKSKNIETVIHLAAKAGVRPSIEDPNGYLKTNIEGTQNVLDWMNKNNIKNLLFASSSSVYGNNKKTPFTEKDIVDFPISPYAYTKKACELLIHTFHHLYDINVLCLRFFTVYGPRQRPDLAIHKFTKLIHEGKSIVMYGDGSTSRDYTYVADTVEGILKSLDLIENSEQKMYEVVNLGNNTPVKLNELIRLLEETIGKKVKIEQIEMQPGDVECTYADISKATQLLKYNPQTDMKTGLQQFNDWYKTINE
ncbi:MAG: GDP-mannose 4,6-dehydratase [Chitinophagales bacterium]